MNFSDKRILTALIAGIALAASVAAAQEVSKLPYMNPNLTPEERAADLVHRMTLEQKASQLVNQARAIPSLSALPPPSTCRAFTKWPPTSASKRAWCTPSR